MSQFSYFFGLSRKIRPLPAAPKVWNYIKYRCLKREAVMSVRRYSPQVASLFLTTRCNLNCAYCSTAARILPEGNGNWREGEANLEKIRRIFANPLFANCLAVDIMGGEPLLVDDLGRIIAYLAQRGHLTNISTNGLLLADRISDLKRAEVSRINVSFYEANRSVLERNLVRINRIFPVDLSLVLLRSEVEEVPDKLLEIARFAHNTGCLCLRFWIYRPMGANPQPEEIITDNNPAYLEFRRRMEDILPGFCFWPATVKTGKIKKLCSQLWQRIGCDMSGNMEICCGTDMTLQGLNSNLFDTEPDAIFNHPTLVTMRKQLIDPGCAPPDVCKNCNLLGELGW